MALKPVMTGTHHGSRRGDVAPLSFAPMCSGSVFENVVRTTVRSIVRSQILQCRFQNCPSSEACPRKVQDAGV